MPEDDILESGTSQEGGSDSVQEMITEMNETSGAEPIEDDKPQIQESQTLKPDEQQSTKKPGEDATDLKDQRSPEELAAEAKKKEKPSDEEESGPEWLQEIEQKADKATKPVEDVDGDASSDDEKSKKPILWDRLSELTEGSIKTEADFVSFAKNYNRLVEDSDKESKPKFETERSQWAYELLANSPGQEFETAQSTMRVLGLPLDKMSAKELQFEAFKLEPKHRHLNGDELDTLFDSGYEQFEGMEGDAVLSAKHKVATSEARDLLQKTQSEFQERIKTDLSKQSAKSEPVEIDPAIVSGIDGAIKEFGKEGLTFSFKGLNDNIDEAIKPLADDYTNMNLKMDEKTISELKNSALDPKAFWESIVNKHVDGEKFDFNGLITELYQMKNMDQVRTEAMKAGFELGQISIIKNRQNPKQMVTGGSSKKGEAQEPKSLGEAWVKAKKAEQV
ncbi:MAG TPA: hypothetical protein ENH65_14640 [Candidatus Aminicenantes bacterium]|nr:hypothetical protein [Candidatus Aminicenantes bacterium]